MRKPKTRKEGKFDVTYINNITQLSHVSPLLAKVINDTLIDITNHNRSKVKDLYKDFTDDKEKMRDIKLLTKEEFLKSYSYLTEKEYDLTKIKEQNDKS